MRLHLGFVIFAISFAVRASSQTTGSGQVLPHIAIGGSYTTEFLVLNTGSTSGSVNVTFYDDNGKLMTAPFPDLKVSGTGFHSATPIAAGGSLAVEAADPAGPTRGGSAVVSADTGIIVQAIFRSRAPDGNYYEASVPTSGGSTRFTMAFDATTFSGNGMQIYTGIGIANLDSSKQANVTCTAKNTAGASIPNAVTVPVLAPLGHWAEYNFPALVGKRGLLDCTSTAQVAAIGLRFLGSFAFSSLSVVQSTAATGTGTGPGNSALIVGEWVSQGPAYLTFNSDGTAEYISSLFPTIPRKGTYTVSQNIVTVNWGSWLGEAPEQEKITIVQNGNAVTLVRASGVVFTRG